MAMTATEQDDYFRRHLKHRMTALLSPLIIGDGNDPTVTHWATQQDVYKAALDGSMITLRLFIEFLGVRSASNGAQLEPIPLKTRRGRLTLEDFDMPTVYPTADLQPSDFSGAGPIRASHLKGDTFNEEQFIAHVHKWISVRAAHLKIMGVDEGRPTFLEHREAAEIILGKIYDRLYRPRSYPLNIDGPLLGRLVSPARMWQGLPFGDW
jgi:hypothetical protein